MAPPAGPSARDSGSLFGAAWRRALRFGARLLGLEAASRAQAPPRPPDFDPRPEPVPAPAPPPEFDPRPEPEPSPEPPPEFDPTPEPTPPPGPPPEVDAVAEAEPAPEPVPEPAPEREARPAPHAPRSAALPKPATRSSAPAAPAPAAARRAKSRVAPGEQMHDHPVGNPSSAPDPAFADAFASALRAIGADFERIHRCAIGGEPSGSDRTREIRAPGDTRRVIGRVELAAVPDAVRAVELADGAFGAWSARGHRERVAVLREAAALLEARRPRLAALLCHETGRTPLEAEIETQQAVAMLRCYCDQIEAHDGYRRSLDATGTRSESVMRPYGAWGVLSDFAAPLSQPAGMLAAVLVTGNTAVFSPAFEAPLSGALLAELLWEAGVPREVLHLVMGADGAVGVAIARHPRTRGIAFGGGHEAGMRLYHGFSTLYPRPTVLELGGKNPAVVLADADLERAAACVARSAFGLSGQRRDACSRVYVAQEVYAAFAEHLVACTRGLGVGDPLDAGVFLGPVVDAAAVARFEDYVRGIADAKGEILVGGAVRRDGALAHGHYVEPTIATLPDAGHRFFYEEMRLPLLLLQPVRGLEEALTLCNAARYGLAAALYGGTPAEAERFVDAIEAGAVYVDPAASATGAWPGAAFQTGWKASGNDGPAALGPHHLVRFLRPQSRTLPG